MLTPTIRFCVLAGIMFGTSLFLVVTEAYGLRLRHIIAGCYYPKRAQERSVWLYNQILRRRGGFLKFMRRKLRQHYKTDQEEENLEKISFLGRLSAT